MSVWFYVFYTLAVFIFSGLLAIAGLGAAFLFVPLFYYMGMPLAEAAPAALLLNVVSLFFAATNFWRDKLINWREWNPTNKHTYRTSDKWRKVHYQYVSNTWESIYHYAPFRKQL